MAAAIKFEWYEFIELIEFIGIDADGVDGGGVNA